MQELFDIVPERLRLLELEKLADIVCGLKSVSYKWLIIL